PIDARQVRPRPLVGDNPRKAPLAPVFGIEADDPSCRLDQLVHHLAWPPGSPVGHLAQEAMNGFAIDPIRIVVEFVPTFEAAPHAHDPAAPGPVRVATITTRSLRSQAPSTIGPCSSRHLL